VLAHPEFRLGNALFYNWNPVSPSVKSVETWVPYLWHWWEKWVYERTSDSDHRRYSRFTLPQAQGASGRTGTVHPQLILSGVPVTLIEGKRPRTKRVKFPLIASDGPKVNLTNEKIYEHIEFP
jgi:hypothetical protein